MSPSIPHHAIYHLPSLALHQGLCGGVRRIFQEGCVGGRVSGNLPLEGTLPGKRKSVKGSERARCIEKGQLRGPDAEAQGSGVLG